MIPPLTKSIKVTYLFLLLISLCIILNPLIVLAIPTGLNITYNVTETIAPSQAASLTTAGGSFTTMILNGSFQTERWKAYVGNISGLLTLDDASGKSIYNWDLAIISGEIYVSRSSQINWSTINCSEPTDISSEEITLNINSSLSDSINNTFNTTTHKSFYVGTVKISNSSCRAISTYVNDSIQEVSEDSFFQEVLLSDIDGNVVYTTILEDSTAGYDLANYNFQLIVPEDPTSPTPSTYYFFAEIS